MSAVAREADRPARAVYDPAAIEAKWQARWAEAGCFRADARPDAEKFFNFDGGPFPNGPLHMGHVRTFTLGDAMARFERMRGKRVLYCFEFDAFGLPNELAAQARGITPEKFTRDNIALMRTQMRRLGLSYDWDHVVTTCDPKYYRWTQWLFLKLRAEGFVYRAAADLNWCPNCATTLAHMQVENGCCWRCDGAVEQRRMTQWYVALSKRSDVLSEGLARQSLFSKRARNVLQGFVATTEGEEIDFAVEGRPGVTLTAFLKNELRDGAPAYLALAAGHPALEHLLAAGAFDEWRQSAARLRRRPDAGAASPLDGIDTGLIAVHADSGLRLPIHVARYVDRHFATGIEIGTPDRAPRDRDFAQRQGIALSTGVGAPTGRAAIYHRVHDWLVSRQRSWGTPIPIVHCERCGEVEVAEQQLPVLLCASPDTTCPRCAGPARRDTDTLDCYFDVIWCFLACASGLRDGFAFQASDFAEWMPVDWFHNGLDSFFYVHLYRFLGRVLHEMGILSEPEPIRSYIGHDAVLLGGRKMSKHHGNVVAPDAIVAQAGADALRIQALWAANPLKSFEWSEGGLKRAERLLRQIWDLVADHAGLVRAAKGDTTGAIEALPLARSTAHAVRRATGFLERYQFGGSLQEIQNLVQRLREAAEGRCTSRADPRQDEAFAAGLRSLVLMLAPFAPHMSEELWEMMGGEGLAATTQWPA